MFDEKLVKRFEYNIDVVRYIDGQPSKMLGKLVIHPIEVGNNLEFKSTKDTSRFQIPIDDITEINTPEQAEETRDKKHVLLEIEFKDSQGDKKSMVINVFDRHIEDLLVKTLKPMEQKYWDVVELEYDLGGITKTTQLCYKTPFLSDGEELLWINSMVEGIANKHIRWLEALTNFRAIYYDFEKHESGRIPLNFVDDVLVKNLATAGFDRIGRFNEVGIRTFLQTGIERHTTRETVGDVLFMRDNKPIVSFLQVSDPYEVANLAKGMINQLFKPVKKGRVRLPMAAVGARENVVRTCTYCGNVNAVGAEFCNNCGFALR
jgi:hypothetical protein